MNKIKLFCFPYAGGSALIYKAWKSYLNPQIELVPVELAGRGIRMGEKLYENMEEATGDVLGIIKPEIGQSPYAIYGHSMGCKIAYELLHKIKEAKLPDPLQVFFSGRSAPHLKKPEENKYHMLDDDQFKAKIIELGGTPPDFFNHPELMKVFLPVLRNDFKLSETDYGPDYIRSLNQDITVLLGQDDIFMIGEGGEWEKHTTSRCHIYYFDGGHFFLHNKVPQIADLINKVLIEGYWPEQHTVN